MMRFNFALNAVLGTLLVTPAVTLGVQHNDSLELTLERTLASLEELARIEQRLQARDTSAIADALTWSEPPLPTAAANPGARDEALVELRGVVSKLQRDVDELESRAPAPAPEAAPTLTSQIPRVEVLDAPGGPATTGLDDVQRRRLGERARPVIIDAPRPAAPRTDGASATGAGAKTSFESQGYSADVLRLGRACYRQGDYERALESFEQQPADAEALYWKARCLEKLQRTTEAVAAYNQVIALPDGGYSAQRAREDLEFLEWRLAFERTRAERSSRP